MILIESHHRYHVAHMSTHLRTTKPFQNAITARTRLRLLKPYGRQHNNTLDCAYILTDS